jgi:hypothetical protein
MSDWTVVRDALVVAALVPLAYYVVAVMPPNVHDSR